MFLTHQLIFTESNVSTVEEVRKLYVWGQRLKDIGVVKDLVNLERAVVTLNEVETLKPFENCQKLMELIVRKNHIKDLREVKFIRKLPNLKSLWLEGNDCTKKFGYRKLIIRSIPQLTKLDNIDITAEERLEANNDNNEYMLDFLDSIGIQSSKITLLKSRRNGLFGLKKTASPISQRSSEKISFKTKISLSNAHSSSSPSESGSTDSAKEDSHEGEIENRKFSKKRSSKSSNILNAVSMLLGDLSQEDLIFVSKRCKELAESKAY
mmetsp:Transcript_7627/g.11444  ORF Transcript_7627/g.11444 Transcript_7627/m.11444 type:complete len:266 (+) Transcript_7627:93-890(+)|eukprot:CAMPEP_0171463192 /NCGR_PEP_ID=MMETSP0945-20130129/6948_1 /TAXON_ID=109269 /ORGANISM="Vaucheria litorea, Strain CCMP2940" /LENGTH=265 /DNA_ID=CAMNT_0011989909 /DNA_START=89 /DNA_END=886 /DNA_ORIENTATION=+